VKNPSRRRQKRGGNWVAVASGNAEGRQGETGTDRFEKGQEWVGTGHSSKKKAEKISSQCTDEAKERGGDLRKECL